MHGPARLSIASVETIPTCVPLVRPFRGSHHQLTQPRLEDGSIELSDAPRLGWELDDEYLGAPRVRR